MEGLVEEATRVVAALWERDHIEDVAANGIITTLPGGESAIVSSVDGELMWSGGAYLQLPWAVAFWVAAKKLATGLQRQDR